MGFPSALPEPVERIEAFLTTKDELEWWTTEGWASTGDKAFPKSTQRVMGHAVSRKNLGEFDTPIRAAFPMGFCHRSW